MNQAPARKASAIIRKWGQAPFFSIQIDYGKNPLQLAVYIDIIRILKFNNRTAMGQAPFFTTKPNPLHYKEISSWPPLNIFDGCRRLGRNFIGNTHHFRYFPCHSLRYLHENFPGDLSRFGCHGVFALH